jgi:hypothetical protein
MTERVTRALKSRGRRLAVLVVLGGALAGMFAVAALALISDSAANCDVQVTNKNGTALCTTTAGAKVRYIGDSNQTFGSSGTGTFNPFVRLQGSPTEAGYNTDGTTEFESKVGTWTHSILVSEIPVRTEDGCSSCWELFVDINDSNNNKVISLNDMEIWFSDDPDLTGYDQFTGFSAIKQYDFAGNIMINDVNQGSGRGDLRYMVPRTGITIPPNCNYGNPLCETYFVLYSKWGTTSGFPSDGGFEEWKVKVYPPAVATTATSAQDWLPNDTATITSAGGQALNGTLTIQLYNGGTCAAGSEVAGQLYQFTLTNEASGTPHSTGNTTHLVTATSTVSWLVSFTSSDPNTIESSSHCESTALTITN